MCGPQRAPYLPTRLRPESPPESPRNGTWRRHVGLPDLRTRMSRAKRSLLGTIRPPKTRPSLRPLFCHYIFADQIAAFAQKMRYLSKIGTFLTDEEVVEVIQGNRPLTGAAFHLSFDDGFRNVVTNAVPVLQDLGIPATFFVPTGVIGANAETVRDYCLNQARYPGVIDVATWDDLARAQECGISIASHTRTHARFSQISASMAAMQDEIAGSKADLESRLGRPCRMISSPFGTTSAVDCRSLEFVRRAGFSACFSAVRGQVRPHQTDPYLIPRHQFEAHWPMAEFRYFIHGGDEAADQSLSFDVSQTP